MPTDVQSHLKDVQSPPKGSQNHLKGSRITSGCLISRLESFWTGQSPFVSPRDIYERLKIVLIRLKSTKDSYKCLQSNRDEQNWSGTGKIIQKRPKMLRNDEVPSEGQENKRP